METRIKVCFFLILLALTGVIFMQYIWVQRLYITEQQRMISIMNLSLGDALTQELIIQEKEKLNRFFDSLHKAPTIGVGCNHDDNSITEYFSDGSRKKKVFDNLDEYIFNSSRLTYIGIYDVTGIDLFRLDSIFSARMKAYQMDIPHRIDLVDFNTEKILESTVPEKADTLHWPLKSRKFLLGVLHEDGVIVRLDNSVWAVFNHIRYILILSGLLVLLVAFMLFYVMRTLVFQRKLSRIRTEVVGDIIHEIKSPITALQRLVEIDHNQIYLHKIDDIHRTIEELRVVSMNKRRISLHKEFFNLKHAISQLLNNYRNEENNIVLIYESEENIIADEVHLINAVRNLVENALKYTDKQKTEIEVRVYKHKGDLCIAVKDNGVGIPRRYWKMIFEKHFRVPEDKTVSRSGSGLGLNYVRMVAYSHGGTVGVKSECGSGSVFTLKIKEVSV
jgi:signal transduction histidine kinase